MLFFDSSLLHWHVIWIPAASAQNSQPPAAGYHQVEPTTAGTCAGSRGWPAGRRAKGRIQAAGGKYRNLFGKVLAGAVIEAPEKYTFRERLLAR